MVMPSSSGNILVRRLLASNGYSKTRATSLTAALAAMVPKVQIWATRSGAVFLPHVGDYPVAVAEVQVDIGHGDAVRD